MKRKMLDHIQPREGGSPRNEQTHQEIQNFLLAVSSYPDRVAKEPRITFRQHLCSLLVATRDNRHGRSSTRVP
jgi:hypothetical protein